MVFLHLDEDTLVLIFRFLPVSSFIALRQTCKRLESISRLRFIWRHACIDQVLSRGYPFPTRQLATASSSELERLVIHALRLGSFWTSPGEESYPQPLEFQASTGTGVSHVQFLPGHGGRFVVTVYKGIWSMITCWDIGDVSRRLTHNARKLGDWCPKNTIFAGFAVNSDPDSIAALAVAVQHGGGTQSIEVLSVSTDDGTSCFRSICNIATTFRPVALQGDLIAFSDDASETIIMNWHENTFAMLKGFQRPVDEHFQYNRCLQIFFAYKSVLVVRARSVELFAEPELRPAGGDCTTYHPIGFHTFGWIDGVAVNAQKGPLIDAEGLARPLGHEPLSILLRSESDDPWASDVHKLEQYILSPNPAFDDLAGLPRAYHSGQPNEHPVTEDVEPPAPYLFPPVRAEHTSPTVRGFLRCRDIALGPSGTALWIQPRAARTAHLTGLDIHSSLTQIADVMNPDYQHPEDVPLNPGDPHRPTGRARIAESLCAAVFAGPLQRRHPEMQTQARTLWVQGKEGCNWTAVDYDEEAGRVALGSSDGSVTVLGLV
ncbi:hypothetical protein BD311DRAFT_728696 [Dichomitus squalens]|uniref:F-box domain-containing protein n=1 Tax=Dichomitus squalens TaxID=114155 RepID=A0A4Q9MCE3_9APHY|nr:hypothetical protein BD311DRAFT_728696 [Dichomitus squalens]